VCVRCSEKLRLLRKAQTKRKRGHARMSGSRKLKLRFRKLSDSRGERAPCAGEVRIDLRVAEDSLASFAAALRIYS
jgi:hypothetical protein